MKNPISKNKSLISTNSKTSKILGIMRWEHTLAKEETHEMFEWMDGWMD